MAGSRARLRWLAVVALVALVILPSTPSHVLARASSSTAGTLVFGSAVPVPSVDPAVGSDDAETNFLEALYDTLYRYQGNPPRLVPWLATKASTSHAGSVWTIQLRKGVHFANGDLLTATDVAYSFDRLLTIQRGYAYLFQPIMKVGSAQAVDAYTVRFQLLHPFAAFLQTLPYAYIVDARQARAHTKKADWAKAWLTDHAAGSGPYVISTWTPNQTYGLVRNPHYWKGWAGPHLKAVQWKVLPELSARELALRVGNVQAINWLDVTAFNAMKSMPGITAVPEPSAQTFMVNMNTVAGPTADPNVRKAIAYATDYNTAIRVIFGGYGTRIGAPIPPGFKGYVPSLAPVSQDLAQAKHYMARSHYAKGVTIQYTYVTGLDEERRLGLLLLSNLKPLGITLKVVAEAWPTLVAQEGNPKTAPSMTPLYFGAQYDSPYNWLYAQYSSTTRGSWQNEAQFSNPQVDRLLALGAQTLDWSKAQRYFAQAERLIVAATPAIYLLQNKTLALYSSKLHWPYCPLGASADFYHMSMSM
jgi:peptide/nickel transport system substrate-binding protein